MLVATAEDNQQLCLTETRLFDTHSALFFLIKFNVEKKTPQNPHDRSLT